MVHLTERVPSPSFKAIELDATSRQRTGRMHLLAATSRQLAVVELLELLGVEPGAARIDPSRTLVQTPFELWTLVGVTSVESPASAAQRRAGAKHKRVR